MFLEIRETLRPDLVGYGCSEKSKAVDQFAGNQHFLFDNCPSHGQHGLERFVFKKVTRPSKGVAIEVFLGMFGA